MSWSRGVRGGAIVAVVMAGLFVSPAPSPQALAGGSGQSGGDPAGDLSPEPEVLEALPGDDGGPVGVSATSLPAEERAAVEHANNRDEARHDEVEAMKAYGRAMGERAGVIEAERVAGTEVVP